ncbi:MAG: WecB/TagA/CpsF family glycosyltransferase [Hyphomicrobiaceae bacterium]|nr:WecB/TagA/CpsF family glycosyltransferase [Hyphomicrobiaceae bacterium]
MSASSSGRIEILGVPISALDLSGVLATLADWLGEHRKGTAKGRYVCACDVHSVMRARDDARHMRALRGADMIVADGTPLVWLSRLRGESALSRVPGPDLLTAVCERSEAEGWSHYFYGGAEGVADKLAERLARSYPGLTIAGTTCPPFRAQTPEEIERDIARINASGADIVWIGLGCPKQELWMHELSSRFQGRILIGVGAAFDFHTGRIVRAPRWMRDNGLEWLHRLMSEPRRLWRRYLLLAPRFLALSLAEAAGVLGRRALAQPAGRPRA